jgi:phosphoglycolate phosphatase
VKLAVFDCDGTLIDGQASICDAMELAFADHRLPPPPRNDIRRAVGLSLPNAIHILLPGAEQAVQLDIVDSYKQHFRAAREAGELQQVLFPGMAELLTVLRNDGWLLGVATGMSQRGLGHCLATHNLTDHFITLQTADHHPSKPNPAMLQAALDEAGVGPGEAVMIGDTSYDMLMARDAGVRAIGVEWGYHLPAELMAAGASAVAADPATLQELISQ